MSDANACPVCGSGRPAHPRILPGLRIDSCGACGHREARHGAAKPGSDYHDQYDAGPFLEALRATRVRQARRLIEVLRRHVPDASGVVDYGAGRGWFLEACRAAGIERLAGVDTSQVSVDGLTRSGIEVHRLSTDEDAASALSRLSFRPRVLSLLDVIEHFPPDRLESRLRSIVGACGRGLELVIVKVPVPGLLYAGASALARVGFSGPFLQLYQAGTWPPHFSYFSLASARLALAAAGLSVIESFGDADFEPAFLGQRIGATGPISTALARVGGEALGAAIGVTGRFDSVVLLARLASALP
ncbi:MAG TPA: methyltransferase domain-containing protein [Thermoanaerobaculia bacterium]|nr:methyltransferase domain-containing protein [Thermoanaerobaculia bacterium]